MPGQTPSPVILLVLLLAFQPVFALAGGGERHPAGDIAQDCTDAEKPGKQQADNEEQFETLFAEAECLRRAASLAGAEWLKTEGLLSLSREKAAAGSWDVAIQLARQARFQSRAALQQAETESEAWKNRVVE